VAAAEAGGGPAPGIWVGPVASVPRKTRGIFASQDALLSLFLFIEVVRNSALVRPSLKGIHVRVSGEYSGASSDAVMAESPTGPREIIATCRAAWGIAYASQSEGTGVDEAALLHSRSTMHLVKSLRGLLGIPSRNDRRNWRSCSWKTGLHIYDGEIWVDPAAFLDLGAASLNELTEIVDVRPAVMVLQVPSNRGPSLY
jgi:hypothetical protein